MIDKLSGVLIKEITVFWSKPQTSRVYEMFVSLERRFKLYVGLTRLFCSSILSSTKISAMNALYALRLTKATFFRQYSTERKTVWLRGLYEIGAISRCFTCFHCWDGDCLGTINPFMECLSNAYIFSSSLSFVSCNILSHTGKP